MRIEPDDGAVEQRVHPGHDWLFVTEGRVRLLLGEREIIVETGEAAEFAAMTSHACTAIDGPAELIMSIATASAPTSTTTPSRDVAPHRPPGGG